MRNTTRLSRLKELKKMLDNHHKLFKRVHFDMEVWNEQKKQSLMKIPKACNTAACALGSACLHTPFKKRGLKLKKNYYGDIVPSYKKEEDFFAGRDFFGITLDESEYLFDPCQYFPKWEWNDYTARMETKIIRKVAPKDVSNRVAKLIKQYKKAA